MRADVTIRPFDITKVMSDQVHYPDVEGFMIGNAGALELRLKGRTVVFAPGQWRMLELSE